MPDFFSRLSYSFGNEDWNTEQKALNIRSGDRVVCITASGDRPLNLLLNDCELTSVDLNPIQNHLLSLKIAAMRELDFDHYLSFLGANPDNSRQETFKKLATHMHPDAAKYWMKNPKMISKGVLYQGALERILDWVSSGLQLFRGRKIEKLFSFKDVEQQREFVKKEWDNRVWQKTVELAFHPRVTRKLIKDPGAYLNLEGTHGAGFYRDGTANVGKYLYNRITQSLESCLANENIILSLVFKGKVLPEAYSPYLTEQGTSIIKNRLDQCQIKTVDVISFLESAEEASFDCFSLSDVASYISPEQFNRLMHAIYRTARPGARFSIRQLFSNHQFPVDLIPHFKRDHQLEQQLEREDRCFVYKFMVGEIVK